jgi:hypothetical protein
MLTRQPSDECSPAYRVRPGDPCVPVGTDDVLSCPDIEARDIEVVGVDVYRLDGNDQDGWGCETGAAMTAVPPSPAADSFDLVTIARPVGLVVACIWLAAFVVGGLCVWLHTHHQAGGEEERRGNVQTISMFIVGTALSLLITLVLGILSWG